MKRNCFVLIASHIGSEQRWTTLEWALQSIRKNTMYPTGICLSISGNSLYLKDFQILKDICDPIPLHVFFQPYKSSQFDHLNFIVVNQNRVLFNAKDIIMFLDDDDLYSPLKIQTIMNLFSQKENDSCIIFHPMFSVEEENEFIYKEWNDVTMKHSINPLHTKEYCQFNFEFAFVLEWFLNGYPEYLGDANYVEAWADLEFQDHIIYQGLLGLKTIIEIEDVLYFARMATFMQRDYQLEKYPFQQDYYFKTWKNLPLFEMDPTFVKEKRAAFKERIDYFKTYFTNRSMFIRLNGLQLHKKLGKNLAQIRKLCPIEKLNLNFIYEEFMLYGLGEIECIIKYFDRSKFEKVQKFIEKRILTEKGLWNYFTEEQKKEMTQAVQEWKDLYDSAFQLSTLYSWKESSERSSPELFSFEDDEDDEKNFKYLFSIYKE